MADGDVFLAPTHRFPQSLPGSDVMPFEIGLDAQHVGGALDDHAIEGIEIELAIELGKG